MKCSELGLFFIYFGDIILVTLYSVAHVLIFGFFLFLKYTSYSFISFRNNVALEMANGGKRKAALKVREKSQEIIAFFEEEEIFLIT